MIVNAPTTTAYHIEVVKHCKFKKWEINYIRTKDRLVSSLEGAVYHEWSRELVCCFTVVKSLERAEASAVHFAEVSRCRWGFGYQDYCQS